MAEKNPERTERVRARINILGLGGHSSTPFKTHNPVTAGFEFVHAVTARLWYEFDSFDNVALYPVGFDAGTKSNIIPETAQLELRLEYAAEGQGEKLKNIVQTSLEAIKSLYSVDYSVQFEEAEHGRF